MEDVEMTSLFFCWWHQIFSDHPIAAEMTSEHELQEPGNLGEVLLENSSPLNYGRSENFGSENCLILFVSTYKHMCKMHQNDGQMIWGSQFSRLLRTSHFGDHKCGRRPRNHPGFAPFVRQSRETASRWSRRLEWYGWEPEAGWPVTHTSGNQWKKSGYSEIMVKTSSMWFWNNFSIFFGRCYQYMYRICKSTTTDAATCS